MSFISQTTYGFARRWQGSLYYSISGAELLVIAAGLAVLVYIVKRYGTSLNQKNG
jgi:hypothetical protein